MHNWLIHPQWNPVAISIGGIDIYWYGICYLVSFIIAHRFLLVAGKKINWHEPVISDIIFYAAIGILIGGRVGYVVIYASELIFTEPFQIIAFWARGRSFHGGMLGVLISLYVYAKKNNLLWLKIMDFISPSIPIGLALGRLGNFINGELWGRVSQVPWAMIFPQSGSLTPRHPSQLYELLLEGPLLFCILLWGNKYKQQLGKQAGLFLITYGVFRFIIEFFREPDAHLGNVFYYFSMGQCLSFPMIVIGMWLFFILKPHANIIYK